MYSYAVALAFLVVAANAAMVPVSSSSMVKSERKGDSFAYSIHDQQSALAPTASIMQPVAIGSRALPLYPGIGAYPAVAGGYSGAYVPGLTGAHVPGLTGVHGVQYVQQVPAASYPVQPVLMTGQMAGMTHVGVPQAAYVHAN